MPKKLTSHQKAKRRAAGHVDWVMRKLLCHAEMANRHPGASAQCLPTTEQCEMLAARLGAALVELEEKQ